MNRWLDTVLDFFAERRGHEPPAMRDSITARPPSELPQAYFQALVSVIWAPLRPAERASAEDRLRRTIADATGAYSVLQPGEAQTAANGAVGRILGGHLQAADVALTVDGADREYAERHEVVLRDSALAKAERHAEFERFQFYGDVLADPTRTRLWWLGGDPSKLPALLAMGGVFEQAAALMSGAPPETSSGNAVADVVKEFLTSLRPEDRALLLSQLPGLFRSYERPDLADRLHPPPVNGHAPDRF